MVMIYGGVYPTFGLNSLFEMVWQQESEGKIKVVLERKDQSDWMQRHDHEEETDTLGWGTCRRHEEDVVNKRKSKKNGKISETN